ncbi:MAG: hypothetical protein HQL86_09630 [Magnetococcales bacterium]|nr:hypothetical protein [Magnetococcales bacterium]
MMREGVDALKRGFQKLGVTPALADQDAEAVRKAERNTEKAYRRAISDLFQVDAHLRALDNNEARAHSEALSHVIEIFKRRELYRHLSNTADRMAEAADVLHDIVVQIS